MSETSIGDLPAAEQLPVYFTCNVGARMTGVNDRTFAAHAVPAARRLEADGKLSALYDQASVDRFRAEYVRFSRHGAR
jgi:hypothetical protein